MANSYHSYAFKSKHSSTKKQWVFLPTGHNWKVVGIWHVLQKRKKKEKRNHIFQASQSNWAYEIQ